ncbi:hypothetical protein GCWU000324_01306 [Kingella oralis ATCC 51147]|uniref:Uncharacterized protein n=1 Tax=Kingella oralis ATCC 51147 TaxID=629741 RepID=C4GGN6_9NEIS|nr:hypothetical protein GCWU000324_01306 [Kingella oralis ATCC 51147]
MVKHGGGSDNKQKWRDDTPCCGGFVVFRLPYNDEIRQPETASSAVKTFGAVLDKQSC